LVRIFGPRRNIERPPFGTFSLDHPRHELIMVETGLGVGNAERAFLRVIGRGLPDAVISLGYCGALDPQVSVADVIAASSYCLVEGQRLESLSLPGRLDLAGKFPPHASPRAGTFITMKEWMKKRDVLTFVDSRMALPVCDMETYALARLCVAREFPFLGVRAVSDGAGQDLSFNPWAVCDDKGNYRTMRALRLFLSRPRLLSHGIALLMNSRAASRNLGRVVSTLLETL